MATGHRPGGLLTAREATEEQQEGVGGPAGAAAPGTPACTLADPEREIFKSNVSPRSRRQQPVPGWPGDRTQPVFQGKASPPPQAVPWAVPRAWVEWAGRAPSETAGSGFGFCVSVSGSVQRLGERPLPASLEDALSSSAPLPGLPGPRKASQGPWRGGGAGRGRSFCPWEPRRPRCCGETLPWGLLCPAPGEGPAAPAGQGVTWRGRHSHRPCSPGAPAPRSGFQRLGSASLGLSPWDLPAAAGGEEPPAAPQVRVLERSVST